MGMIIVYTKNKLDSAWLDFRLHSNILLWINEMVYTTQSKRYYPCCVWGVLARSVSVMAQQSSLSPALAEGGLVPRLWTPETNVLSAMWDVPSWRMVLPYDPSVWVWGIFFFLWWWWWWILMKAWRMRDSRAFLIILNYQVIWVTPTWWKKRTQT